MLESFMISPNDDDDFDITTSGGLFDAPVMSIDGAEVVRSASVSSAPNGYHGLP